MKYGVTSAMAAYALLEWVTELDNPNVTLSDWNSHRHTYPSSVVEMCVIEATGSIETAMLIKFGRQLIPLEPT